MWFSTHFCHYLFHWPILSFLFFCIRLLCLLYAGRHFLGPLTNKDWLIDWVKFDCNIIGYKINWIKIKLIDCRSRNGVKHYQWATDVFQCSGTDIFVKPSQVFSFLFLFSFSFISYLVSKIFEQNSIIPGTENAIFTHYLTRTSCVFFLTRETCGKGNHSFPRPD